MVDNKARTFSAKNDLKLANISAPKSCPNIAVADELNDYLRDQIYQLMTENENLRQTIAQKDNNLGENHALIDELSGKLQEYESLSNDKHFATATQVSAAAVADLSKKLREKSSEIEVYKSKCTKLAKIVKELREQQVKIIEKPTEKGDETTVEVDEKKRLQDKLTQITNKWMEEKNQALKLRNDLKLANKWLQQEIGDKFETLLALNANTNASASWRGRAQIIQDLQQKNSELRQKLKDQDKGDSPKSVSKTDLKRWESLSRENREIKESHEELKQKFENAKARVRVLENECGQWKSKLNNLKEERETDQAIIASLKSKLSNKNSCSIDEVKQRDKMLKLLQKENEELKLELERTRCLLDNKSREIVEKNDDIDVLNKRIRSARPTSSYMNRPENPETKIISRLEVERARLLELGEVQSKRLEEERNSHQKTQQTLRLEKQKRTKLEAKLAKQELEEHSNRSGYSNRTPKPAASSEDMLRDKLELAEEQVKALTTRLELESLERKRDMQEFAKILEQRNLQSNK